MEAKYLTVACAIIVFVLLQADWTDGSRWQHGKGLSKLSGIGKKTHKFSNRTRITGLEIKSGLSSPSNDICDIICDEFGDCTEYVCEDGVCCTPGSPYSLCCPYDHPVCDVGGCCAAEYPKECGAFCCETTAICCPAGCCDAPDYCCGVGCCDATEVCCTDHCCDTGEKCCGTGCCASNETCCTVGGQLQCCSQTDCANSDFEWPCLSLFDARPCGEKHEPSDLSLPTSDCPLLMNTKVLYRILRPDESCDEGLKAKFPHAQKSVLSFVNCGSKKDFSSQFIAFTSSLKVAETYAKGLEGSRIASITVNEDLLSACEVIDLTSLPENQKYTWGKSSGKFATSVCGYLLTCRARLPCKELQ